jgi:molybdopterin-guanine dinucleotide biosynthesis protein A
MGTDKARLIVGGETLLERAVAAVGAAAREVVLATGVERRYEELGLSCVLDRLGSGPLAGLEAVLAHYAAADARGAWVALLACDMPRCDPEVLRALHRSALARGLDACLLETETGLEPLCAVYHTRCLPAVRSALVAGERRMIAFHTGHGSLAVGSLAAADVPGADPDSARNVNTPAELRRASEAQP